MEHLSPETLARLVEEAPVEPERRHLERCLRCRSELQAMRDQTGALRSLPALRPPQGGWNALEARLRAERLVGGGHPQPERAATEPPASGGTAVRLARTPWGRAAAIAAILLVGMGMGMGVSTLSEAAPANTTRLADRSAEQEPVEILALDFDAATEAMTIAEAAELVRLTEEWYLTSLVRYQQRMQELPGAEPVDPIGRFAAIEALMAAGQAAVREAPTDPFLNGLLLNMYAERENALRGLQAHRVGDNWY